MSPGPSRSSASRARRTIGAGGFTLVEIMVALAIAAMVLAIAPVALGRAYETMQYRATVRSMLADMKSARLEAARSGRPSTFTVDLETRRFGVGEQLRSELPEALEVHVVVAQTEIRPDGRAAIRFYPEGGATGGSIELVRPSGAGVRLRIDWLLGRVTQEVLGA
jgi:general secretion pathway protein H